MDTKQQTISRLTEKWAPLTEGMNHDATKQLASWCYEREARFLKTSAAPTYGDNLKLVFPLINRSVRNLTGDAGEQSSIDPDIAKGTVHEITAGSYCDVAEAANYGRPDMEQAMDSRFVRDIAGRLHENIRSFMEVYSS